VLERVRKMHAKAESARAIGSIAEAETFASAVQRMLEKHKLEMSDIELAAQDADDPLDEAFVDFDGWGLMPKARRDVWAMTLGAAVARAHYCRAVDFSAVAGKQKLQFIGRHSDRLIAEHVFLTLYRSAQQMSKDAARSHKEQFGKDADRQYRKSWLTGFVIEIAKRYKELASARANHMALVRADSEAEAYMKKLHPRLHNARPRFARSSRSGIDDGKIAGRNANINPAKGVTGSWAPRTRQLTSGG
jgi:hypothetical protein